MDRFVDKRIVVTGTASGIGKATAERLAAEGGNVVCIDLSAEGAASTAAVITAAGGRAASMACDVSSAAAVEATVAAAAEHLGGIDIVCNIAGIGHFAHTHEETPEWFDRIVGVNLNGTFLMCRFALPHLLATGNGVIVNTASTAGLIGQPWSAAYCASKGGVVLLTKALATEYKGKGVRANAIAPGGTNTNILGSFGPPKGADWKELTKIMTPMPNAEPSEIAGAFAYVASDEARYMTGAIVNIDGGIAS